MNLPASDLRSALQNFGLQSNFSEDELKQVFRKAVLIAHPDRHGGSNELFDFVKSQYDLLYAYMQSRISGGKDFLALREESRSFVEESSSVTSQRKRSLPNEKFDVVRFNDVFEQHRGDCNWNKDTGYGDWLKQEDSYNLSLPVEQKNITRSSFNDVFDKTKEIIAQKQKVSSELLKIPDAASDCLTSCGFTFLGEESVSDFTASQNGSLHYVDLRRAHTDTMLVDPNTVKPRKEYQSVQQYEHDRQNISSQQLCEEELLYLKQREAEDAEKERRRQLRVFELDKQAEKHHARVTQSLLR